jgi:ABC-type transporter Mla MlaB component
VATTSGPYGEAVPLDVSGLAATTGALAALARLRLAAHRTGRTVLLTGASPGLRALLELAGLDGEFEWDPEEREQPGGVEE